MIEAVASALAFVVVGVAIAVAKSLVVREVEGWLPHLQRAIVRIAARRLPGPYVARFTEEWLAELATLEDRPLSAVRYALGTFGASWKARRFLRSREVKATQSSVRIVQVDSLSVKDLEVWGWTRVKDVPIERPIVLVEGKSDFVLLDGDHRVRAIAEMKQGMDHPHQP